MKYDRTTAVTLAFVILSIGSAVYISLAALNYLNLYPALEQIDKTMPFQTNSVALIKGANPSIVTDVSVSNPTAYSGIDLAMVTVNIYFFADSNSNKTLFNKFPPLSGAAVPNSPLEPRSNTMVAVTIPLSPENLTQLTDFNYSNQGQITANVVLRVDLSTFLVAVTGTIFYTRIQDVPLTA